MEPSISNTAAWMVVLLFLLMSQGSHQQSTETTDQLNQTVRELIRQSILQQFHIEQQTRLRGRSGIRQQRITTGGTQPYHSAGFTGEAVFGCHSHPNFFNTVGLGELDVVLNGVEFITRHNDYILVCPSKTSSDYEATETIPYPPVPPEVLNKATVQEQIIEMREWFKAWAEQDHTVRDYRTYFRPVLTYLEGAWTHTGEKVDEPFPSTRHYIDAETWMELEEQSRFLAYSGEKHSHENIAHLPKVIIDVAPDGTPIYAQWNYRMLSHMLSEDLPLDRLRVIDDLQSRIRSQMTLSDFAQTPRARFSLLPEDVTASSETGTYNMLLEKLMREIPGKDNYPGDLQEDGYWGLVVDPQTGKTINTAYYHSTYAKKLGRTAPRKTHLRGFSDHVFMAMTTQEKVVGMEDVRCASAKGKFQCDSALKKWTYAIPIEIVYLTPLQSWNPYDLEYKGDADSDLGKTVTENGKDGSKENPFNGTHSKMYTQVPHGFFYDEVGDGKYPTNGFYVLDKKDNVQPVVASGIAITLQGIPGIGRLRQRYPIGPVHEEGSVVWKELAALKEVMLKPNTYKFMFHPEDDTGDDKGSGDVELQTGLSTLSDNPHTHTLRISGSQMENLLAGDFVIVTTAQASGHTHVLKLYYDENDSNCASHILWKRCDKRLNCFDKHPKCLERFI